MLPYNAASQQLLKSKDIYSPLNEFEVTGRAD